MSASHPVATEATDLHRIIEDIAHYLPSQGPLKTFVHHNTLHHFEHLEFFDALDAALVAAIAIALTLNGFSSFRLFARVFMGQPVLGHYSQMKLPIRERLSIYSVIAVIILNGLAPSFIVDSLSHIGH